MERATLGGVPGAGAVRSRRRSESVREFRGTFVFQAQHEPAVMRLFNSRDRVEYEGPVDGERRMLRVILTDVSPESGTAHFEAAGE